MNPTYIELLGALKGLLIQKKCYFDSNFISVANHMLKRQSFASFPTEQP